jgi:hypothetical protein
MTGHLLFVLRKTCSVSVTNDELKMPNWQSEARDKTDIIENSDLTRTHYHDFGLTFFTLIPSNCLEEEQQIPPSQSLV